MIYPNFSIVPTTSNAATLLVSLADAKAQLRIESGYTAEDDKITAYIKAATKMAEQKLWGPIINQDYLLTQNAFSSKIRVNIAPVVDASVVVKYYDDAGVLQTLAGSEYRVDYNNTPVIIQPVDSWPSVQERIDAVQVTFTAGYGADGTNVPEPIKQAVLMMVAQLFENREGKAMKDGISNAADLMLDYYANRYYAS